MTTTRKRKKTKQADAEFEELDGDDTMEFFGDATSFVRRHKKSIKQVHKTSIIVSHLARALLKLLSK